VPYWNTACRNSSCRNSACRNNDCRNTACRNSADPPLHCSLHNIHRALDTHTHTPVCLGLPRWASTRKVKPIWISLKQETVSGSGISWAICKSAPRSTHSHTSTPPLSFFTGRMPFLPPNQQCQSTEGHKVP